MTSHITSITCVTDVLYFLLYRRIVHFILRPVTHITDVMYGLCNQNFHVSCAWNLHHSAPIPVKRWLSRDQSYLLCVLFTLHKEQTLTTLYFLKLQHIGLFRFCLRYTKLDRTL